MNDNVQQTPGQLSTKDIANKVGAEVNDAVQKIVTDAITKLGIELKDGKNGKHFSKVMGHALVKALKQEGIPLDVATLGVQRGASNAQHKLTPPPLYAVPVDVDGDPSPDTLSPDEQDDADSYDDTGCTCGDPECSQCGDQ